VKGGRLAETAAPAPTLALILSDVPGDRIETIASGPTCPDPSTYADAREALSRAGVLGRVPEVVRRHLEEGFAGAIPETPKPGAPFFSRVRNRVIGNSARALDAARRRAEELGFPAHVDEEPVTGEARVAGGDLARAMIERRRSEEGTRPAIYLSGGETTVTVLGEGRGGRNMELALAFALAIEGEEGLGLLSAGSDGIDGPTDAAGAWVDGTTISRARALGIDPLDALRRNDSYSFFERLEDLFLTGATGTNVMDLQMVWVG
jgi:glycerate-2-kinase